MKTLDWSVETLGRECIDPTTKVQQGAKLFLNFQVYSHPFISVRLSQIKNFIVSKRWPCRSKIAKTVSSCL